MTKYVALLRGIAPVNPNMRNDKLRAVFENLGFSNVQSVISSGNILFETSRKNIVDLEQVIEKALFDALGITSTTLIRSKSQLQQLVDDNPFVDYEHNNKTYLVVTFLQTVPEHALALPQKYHIAATYSREVCAVIDNSTARSPDPIMWIEKNYGKHNTTRTYKTVQRILAKMA